MTTLSQLAKSLTAAQREAVRTGHCSHEVAVSSKVEPLWFAIEKLTPTEFRIALNRDGLALRAHLKGQTDEG